MRLLRPARGVFTLLVAVFAWPSRTACVRPISVSGDISVSSGGVERPLSARAALNDGDPIAARAGMAVLESRAGDRFVAYPGSRVVVREQARFWRSTAESRLSRVRAWVAGLAGTRRAPVCSQVIAVRG